MEVNGGDGTLHLIVEGSADQVIKAAARLEVVRIVTHDADLEDVFQSYYQREQA